MSNFHSASQMLENSAIELAKLSRTFDYNSFSKFVNNLNDISGKIVVTGVGKSSIVAKKLVATLNAVSIPSVFLSSGDAFHGDIGVIQPEDALLFVSKSGNTEDLINIAKIAIDRNVPIFLISNNVNNTLTKLSDFSVSIENESELDESNLIPTTSVLLQIAVCDVLAISLMKKKGLTFDTFTSNHPKGTIGKIHNVRVVNCARMDDSITVSPRDLVSIGINRVSKTRKGAVVVIDNGNVVGIITDGDIRRMLEKSPDISQIKCQDIMSENPLTIDSNALASQALDMMTEKKVSQLIVIDSGKYLGLIHMHDLF